MKKIVRKMNELQTYEINQQKRLKKNFIEFFNAMSEKHFHFFSMKNLYSIILTKVYKNFFEENNLLGNYIYIE